jgi:hypothetical protein
VGVGVGEGGGSAFDLSYRRLDKLEVKSRPARDLGLSVLRWSIAVYSVYPLS